MDSSTQREYYELPPKQSSHQLHVGNPHCEGYAAPANSPTATVVGNMANEGNEHIAQPGLSDKRVYFCAGAFPYMLEHFQFIREKPKSFQDSTTLNPMWNIPDPLASYAQGLTQQSPCLSLERCNRYFHSPYQAGDGVSLENRREPISATTDKETKNGSPTSRSLK